MSRHSYLMRNPCIHDKNDPLLIFSYLITFSIFPTFSHVTFLTQRNSLQWIFKNLLHPSDKNPDPPEGIYLKRTGISPELYHLRHPKSPSFLIHLYCWKPRSLISAHGTLPKITTANSRFTRFNRSAKGPSAKLVAPGKQRGKQWNHFFWIC